MDSLKIGMNHLDWGKVREGSKIKLDSIADLFPEKLSIWPGHTRGMSAERFSDDLFSNIESFSEFPETRFLKKDLSSSNTVADKIAIALLDDGLVSDDEVSEVELTGKSLKIDGEKQPSNIWKKYRKIYEKETGITLSKRSKVELQVRSDVLEKKRFFN